MVLWLTAAVGTLVTTVLLLSSDPLTSSDNVQLVTFMFVLAAPPPGVTSVDCDSCSNLHENIIIIIIIIIIRVFVVHLLHYERRKVTSQLTSSLLCVCAIKAHDSRTKYHKQFKLVHRLYVASAGTKVRQ